MGERGTRADVEYELVLRGRLVEECASGAINIGSDSRDIDNPIGKGVCVCVFVRCVP